MASDWGTFDTPCPNCSGQVEWYDFGQDCRGNAASSGISCKNCGRQFTWAEWNLIAKEEMARRRQKEALVQCGFAVKYLRERLESNPEELKELQELLFKGETPSEGEFLNPSLHKLLLKYAEAYGRVGEIVIPASVS